MPENAQGIAPWMPGPQSAVNTESLRPSVLREADGLLRLRGAHDPCTLSLADRSKPGRFVFEAPSGLAGLDMERVRMEADAAGCDIDLRLRDAIYHGILQFVDAMDRVRGDDTAPGEVQARDVLSGFVDQAAQDAPDSLIHRIANKDGGRLAQLCGAPRNMLRRERKLVRVAQAKHLDVSCMRWLDVQPGRDIVEKAGTAQRIRAVVRRQTPDTLENRVLLDLLRRAIEAADEYSAEHKKFETSARYKRVRNFGRELQALARLEQLEGVLALQGVPTPNYVLQNDRRYKHVWHDWHDLLRKKQYVQQTIRWAARWLSEVAFLGALEQLTECEGRRTVHTHPLRLRPEPVAGEFLESSAPIGSFRLWGSAGEHRVHVLRSAQLARGIWPARWKGWAQLAPDFALIPECAGAAPTLCWTLVAWTPQQCEEAGVAATKLSALLCAQGVQGVLFIAGALTPLVLPNLRMVAGETPRLLPAIAGGVIADQLAAQGMLR